MDPLTNAIDYLAKFQARAYRRIGFSHDEALSYVASKNKKTTDYVNSNLLPFPTTEEARHYLTSHRSFVSKTEIELALRNFSYEAAIDYQNYAKSFLLKSQQTELESILLSRFVQAVEPILIKKFKELAIEFPDDIIVSTLPLGDINGLFKPVPNSKFSLILFQENFCTFFVEALWLFYVFSDMTRSKVERSTAVSDLASLVKAFLTDRDLYLKRRVTSPNQPAELVNFFQTRVVPLLCFVFSHELGHKCLGHSEKILQSNGDVDLWQCEFEADLFAFKILVSYFDTNALKDNQEVFPFFIAYSYFHFIDIIYLSEQIMKTGNIQGVKYPKSHPSPQFRKSLIKSLAFELNEDSRNYLISYLDSIDNTFKKLLEGLKGELEGTSKENIRSGKHE